MLVINLVLWWIDWIFLNFDGGIGEFKVENRIIMNENNEEVIEIMLLYNYYFYSGNY